MANKAPNKTLFWSFYVSFCTFCASLRLTRTVFTRLQLKVRPKGLHNFAFYILIFDFSQCSYALVPCILCPMYLCLMHLCLIPSFLYNCREDSTTIESSLQINLFMQNKANFRKVKLDVSPVNTKDYDQMNTWSIRKTKPIKPN